MAILSFWGVSALPYFPEYYGTFHSVFFYIESYLALFFCTFAFVLWDVGTELTMRELRKWRREAKVRARYQVQLKEAKDPAVIKRQITSFQNRGYAFSQAPGNDILVTDNLTNRMAAAFQQQMEQSNFLHGVPLYNGGHDVSTSHAFSMDSQADNLLLKDKAEAGGLFSILKRNAAAAGVDLRTGSNNSIENQTPTLDDEVVEEGTGMEGSQPVIPRDTVPNDRRNSDESEYKKKEGE